MDVIPTLSVDLIVKLREAFPVQPQGELHTMTNSDVAHYAGQQSVIELLELRLQQAKEERLSVQNQRTEGSDSNG